MIIERFGKENSGFDFSDAEINGQVPDPKTFMGGLKYVKILFFIIIFFYFFYVWLFYFLSFFYILIMNFNEAELNFITKEFQKENDDISKKKKLIANIYNNKSELQIDILNIINNFKNDKNSVLLSIIYLGNIQNDFKYQSKQFWNDVSKLKEFYVVFQKIKPLKLRNIWEKLKQSKKVSLITEIIQKDKNIINESYGVNLIIIVNWLIKISKVELNLNNRIEKIKEELKKLSKGKKNEIIKTKENQNYENIQNAFKVNNKINLDKNLKQIKKKLNDKNSKSKILNYSLFTNDNNKEEFDLITSAIQSLGIILKIFQRMKF